MPTIEERALALMYEVRKERGLTPWYEGRGSREDSSLLEAFCREIEAHDATLAEFDAYKHEVSDSVEDYLDQWRNSTPSRAVFACQFGSFILAKPNPLAEVQNLLNDGLTLEEAIESLGLKLVEAGDAD